MRYKTIDACLRNRLRKWTLEDLITRVSDTLENQEGIFSGVSKRTIQADIQLMRSNKLGYNAPIVVTDKKYYAYDDPEYSITKMPVKAADVEKMKEIVGMLKQLNGFNYFEEMSDMITKLENNLYTSTNQTPNYIQFETNRLLKGIEYLNPLYQAVLHQRPLSITYQSFKATEARSQIYYPYLLKQHRNRWFLLAKAKDGKYLLTLALDRIVVFEPLINEPFEPYTGVDFDRYFEDVIGVTKNERDRGQKILLFINKEHAPYVITKPLHMSQQVINEDENGIIIQLRLVLNFELEREILGFGECVKVLAPRKLTLKIKARLQQATGNYKDENP